MLRWLREKWKAKKARHASRIKHTPKKSIFDIGDFRLLNVDNIKGDYLDIELDDESL